MQKYVYCVSCDRGREKALKRELSQLLPEVTVYYPLFDREEHKGKKWIVKTHPLIPGYLFLYANVPITADMIYRSKYVNKLLGYAGKTGDGNSSIHTLVGTDLDFAKWVYRQQGHIKLSRAMLVGQKTKIIDGPLLDYEGEIIKINRQRRSALVNVSIGEMQRKVWLSFHWMVLKDGELTDWTKNEDEDKKEDKNDDIKE